MSRRFPIAAFAIVLAVAVGVAALAIADGPAALKIDGHQVTTRDRLDDQLAAIAESAAFSAQLRGAESTEVPREHEIDDRVTAVWMTIRTLAAVAERELARRDEEVPAEAFDSARAQLGQFDGFAELPKKLRGETIAYLATIIGLQENLASEGSPALDAAVKEMCPSSRFAAHILVATPDAANALAAQLASGGDFATLAGGASSTDSGSAPNGGELGCLTQGQYVAEFQAAADALPIGKVSAPVQTQFGYHLIQVRDRPMRSDLLQASGTVFGNLVRKTPVVLDSRYGTWQAKERRVCPLSGC